MTIVVVKLKHWNQSNNLAVFTVPVWIRHASGMWQCSKWKVQYTVGDDGVIFNEHLFSSFWPSFSRLALHTSDLDLWLNSTPYWCKNHFCSLKTELLSYKYFFVKTGGDNLLKKRLESRCLIQELYLYSEHCQTNMAYMSGLGTVAGRSLTWRSRYVWEISTQNPGASRWWILIGAVPRYSDRQQTFSYK